MKNWYSCIIVLLMFLVNFAFSQSGTFDFYPGASGTGSSISETVDGVTLTIYSDNSTEPYPSMTLQDWSSYPPFTNNVATMNGQAKPSCTFTFSQAVNISTLLVSDFEGSSNPHLLFTPNTGTPYHTTIDGYNGSYVTLDFVQITSFVITNYDGGNIDLGFDQVVMDASLPVELSSFAAQQNGQAVQLSWRTESETDNLGFIIERCSENSGWQQLASYKTSEYLAGQGTTQAATQYNYQDASVVEGAKYSYRLSDVDINGQAMVIATTEVETAVTPVTTQLFPAYPNPFNPQTTLRYQLAQDSHVTLAVYDVLGRQIKLLANQQQAAGEYTATWDGTTNAGMSAPSGTYLVRMEAGNISQIQKVLLIK